MGNIWTRKKLPLILVAALIVGAFAGGTASAAHHEAYWVDSASGSQIVNDTYPMLMGETITGTLMAELPAGKTLKAFKFVITYDPNVVSVTKADLPAGTVFPNTFINAESGQITVNGFSVTGLTAGAEDLPVSIVDVTIKGVAIGDAQVTVNPQSFGENATVQYLPLVIRDINVTISAVTGSAVLSWADASTGSGLQGFPLNVGESREVRVIAAIPVGETLKAYNFSVLYDATVIEVANASVAADSPFQSERVLVNSGVAGLLETNGFDLTGVAGGDNGTVVSLLDFTITGKVATQGTGLQISVDRFGASAANTIPTETRTLGLAVLPLQPGMTETYWADDAGIRINQISIPMGDVQTLRLMAEIPSEKTLSAFKYTLGYDSTLVGVVDLKATDTSVFETTFNHQASVGTIYLNGFDATGVAGGATGKSIALVDVTLMGNAEGAFAFSILVDSFGASSSDQFKPMADSLYVDVVSACDAVATFTATTDGAVAMFDTTGSYGDLSFKYGDGATGTQPSHSYANSGVYQVSMTATDRVKGCSVSVTKSVDVTVPTTCPAIAAFTASLSGFTATFDTTGATGDLSFDYGDGQTGIDASHTYAEPGSYLVTLSATNATDNCTVRFSRTVVVAGCDALAVLYATTEGLTVIFNASGSVGDLSINFDNGEIVDLTGQTITYQYATAGTYTATLTATDPVSGCTSAAQVTVTPSVIEPGENEAYWADAATNARLADLTLDIGEQQVLRLKAEIPSTKVLEAYRFTLELTDKAVAEIVSVVPTPGSAFAPTTINDQTAGVVIINGLNTAGVQGEAVLSLIDVTVRGAASGTSTFQITVNTFGNDNETFAPTASNLVLHVSNPLAMPTLVSPADGAVEVALAPMLTVSGFNDPDNDAHSKTEWQISTIMNDFSTLALAFKRITMAPNLLSFQLPTSILMPNTTYYWRVRFVDSAGVQSAWSNVGSFTTVTITDTNDNGVPDEYETIATNDPATPWIKNTDSILGGTVIGVIGNMGQVVRLLAPINPANVPGMALGNINMPTGLVGFKLATAAGDTTELSMRLADPTGGETLYLYNSQTGEFDAFGTIGANGTVAFNIQDGGPYDADGVANGVISMPYAGFGVVVAPPTCTANAAFTVVQTSSGSMTVKVDPSGSVGTLLWDYGDGMTSNKQVAHDHTYASYGAYTIKLTATTTGANGCTRVTNRTIEVDRYTDDTCFISASGASNTTRFAWAMFFGALLSGLIMLWRRQR